MRLADYILQNANAILDEWDEFARHIWPHAEPQSEALRDHAEELLRATAEDMQSEQTERQRSDKAWGVSPLTRAGRELSSVSRLHAVARVGSGLDLRSVVAEYRALRAAVVRRWAAVAPGTGPEQANDLVRFNECIDQSLTVAIDGYMEEVDRSRRLFLGILGHDLRGPLNAILVSAEGLASMAKDEGDRVVARRIVGSSRAMTGLLSDFLDFAAAQLGRSIPVEPAPVHLGYLAQEVVEEVRVGMTRGQLQLASIGEVEGEWDEARLRQVISNLINNAVEHGPPAGKVMVEVEGAGDEVRLRVRNAGRPIPPELLTRVFEPMLRGADHETRPGGMGLGLYIVQAIVAAHGGRTGVESTAEAGTVFTVSLPRRIGATAR